MSFLSETWGTTAHERDLSFPCDALIPNPHQVLYRGVTIQAPPELAYRWLCQLRVAPYSYDWIDNCSRQSPRKLTPGLEKLAIGQDLMGIFDIVSFAQNVHLTMRIKPGTAAGRIFGDIAGTYLVVPNAGTDCRLLVKLIARYPQSLGSNIMRQVLPWGDLIMMRKQLLNIKELAERYAGDTGRRTRG